MISHEFWKQSREKMSSLKRIEATFFVLHCHFNRKILASFTFSLQYFVYLLRSKLLKQSVLWIRKYLLLFFYSNLFRFSIFLREMLSYASWKLQDRIFFATVEKPFTSLLSVWSLVIYNNFYYKKASGSERLTLMNRNYGLFLKRRRC
jgi:hypothetical protein